MTGTLPKKFNPPRLRATLMLIAATGAWGLSFTVFKAMAQAQMGALAHANTWFISSYSLLIRFGGSALILLVWIGTRRELRPRRREWEQGTLMGLSGGVAMLFQMDSLSYTAASTSAFLTQCYCLTIPLWVALRTRRLPTRAIFVSCLLVAAGVGILSGLNVANFRLGRGEVEALLCSLFFAVQILALEPPRYAANRAGPRTLIMFVILTFCVLPVVVLAPHRAGDFARAYADPQLLLLLGVLTLLPTLFSYSIMNRWQPLVSSTEASLIYCTEPLFAGVFALGLPTLLSRLLGIQYLNESLTANLLIGGSLILAANLALIQRGPRL